MALDNRKKVNFVLGIDGGATKTIARLINVESDEQWQVSAGPSSLSHNFSDAINILEKLIKELVNLSRCELANVATVFGLAGTENTKLVASLQLVFANRFACFDICSDAKTSAYGANDGAEVVAVALGTGSVGMRLQRSESGELTHHLVGGWGFFIGDEGGGAKLGYYGVQTLVAEFQHFGYANSKLAQSIATFIGANVATLSRYHIANWLVLAQPIDFAQLAPLVFQHQHTCSVAEQLLAEHAKHVQNLIDDTRANVNLPVVLLGGLAQPTMALLSKTTQSLLISPKGSALDGACLLAKQLI